MKTSKSTLSIPFVLVVAMGFSGCLAAGDSDPGVVAVLIEGDQCLQGADACGFVDGLLIVEAATGFAGAEIGILVRNLSVPLGIVDTAIDGPAIGIAVEGSCTHCSIEIAGTKIEAAMGIVVATPGEIDLSIRGSTITASGVSERTGGWSGTAIRMLAPNATMNVENTTFGDGVNGISGFGHELRVAAVTVDGPLAAISGHWKIAEIRDTIVACKNKGINFPEASVARLVNTTVEGCRVGSYGIALGAVLGSPGREVVVRDSRIDGNLGGMFVGTFEEVLIERSSISNNTKSGFVTTAAQVHINEVAVESNGLRGIVVYSAMDVQISRGNIAGNEAAAGSEGAGILVAGREHGEYTISDSNIEGNMVRGVVAANYVTHIYAAGNWWGSPVGPAPASIDMLGNPALPVFGDPIQGRVVAVPHRAAPVDGLG